MVELNYSAGWDPEAFVAQLGVVRSSVHGKASCSGDHCVIHRPSNHHMRSWVAYWRADIGTVERICPHGLGHPDPDSASHLRRLRGVGVHSGVHGCDGCCRP